MLEQVVRVIDGSWVKAEYPVKSLGSEYIYVILHKILMWSSDKDMNQWYD